MNRKRSSVHIRNLFLGSSFAKKKLNKVISYQKLTRLITGSDNALQFINCEVIYDDSGIRKSTFEVMETSSLSPSHKNKKCLEDEPLKECYPKEPQIEPLKKSSTTTNIKLILSITVIISIICTLSYNHFNHLFAKRCIYKEEFLQKIESDLEDNVFGQKNVTEIIISTLENMGNSSNYFNILAFVGSSGVGKSYIASLISHNFHKDCIFNIGMTSILNKVFKNDVLKPECCTLIIIDNLVASDIEIVVEFFNHIPKELPILAVPIFNVQGKRYNLDSVLNYEEINLIQEKLSISGLYYKLVLFNYITKDIVLQWISKQLNNFENIDDDVKIKIIERLVFETDFTLGGLKTVHKKLLLELLAN